VKQAMLGALSMICLTGCASVGQQAVVEQGYDRGALGVAAIAREDWAAAEQGLTKGRSLPKDDPARLINLGSVYMETERPAMALAAWRTALASERHQMVETIGGRWVSTRELAEQALARYESMGDRASR
jgi:hypothetical protein